MPRRRRSSRRSTQQTSKKSGVLGQVADIITLPVLALIEVLVATTKKVAGLISGLAKFLLQLAGAVSDLCLKPFDNLLHTQKIGKVFSAASGANWVGGSIIFFFFASLISIFFPARFDNPGWYAEALRALVGNGGLLIFGLFCFALSTSLNGGDQPARQSNKSKQRKRPSLLLAQFMAVVFLLLIPAFSYITVLTWNQLNTNAKDQISNIHDRRDEALRQIASGSNPEPLRQLIKAAAVPQPSPAAPLQQLKDRASDVVVRSSIIAEEQSGKQRRQAQVGAVIEAIRMAISSFALAVASFALAKWLNLPAGPRLP